MSRKSKEMHEKGDAVDDDAPLLHRLGDDYGSSSVPRPSSIRAIDFAFRSVA